MSKYLLIRDAANWVAKIQFNDLLMKILCVHTYGINERREKEFSAEVYAGKFHCDMGFLTLLLLKIPSIVEISGEFYIERAFKRKLL